ncbi:hypothetical protein HYS29_00105 [Candidatus Microgenomates bacterium]|nr:hypothetical protein [Candidatus Microgenomates bacterium]MBI2622066.1 hypothetical protein [Candidatus Microgenomates bacterium]
MKKIISGVLDFVLAFGVSGWLLTRLSGGEGTFQLQNMWFVAWIVVVVLYYVLSKKYLGKTVGQKITESF